MKEDLNENCPYERSHKLQRSNVISNEWKDQEFKVLTMIAAMNSEAELTQNKGTSDFN